MRVSTAQTYALGLRYMGQAQVDIARTQEQISASRRVLTPADDPVAATLELAMRQDRARSAQSQRNADLAEHDLRQQDVTLASVEDLVLQVRDLGMQAGNATMSSDQRIAIVAALNGAVEQLMGFFNTRSADGSYLFAGASAGQPPFAMSPTGVLEYRGDDLGRYVEVGAGVVLQARNSGRELFGDVPTAAPTIVATPGAGNTGTGNVTTGSIDDGAAYAAIYPDDLVVSFTGPPSSYTVSRVDRVNGTVTPQGGPHAYVPGEALDMGGLGVSLTIDGSPDPGDRFVLEARHSLPLVTTVQRLAQGLSAVGDTPQGAVERQRIVGIALADLDAALISLDGARVGVGARLAQLDTARDDQRSMDMMNDEMVASLIDLDVDEAASRLAFQTLVLQAARQSLVMISGLSLFSYLR